MPIACQQLGSLYQLVQTWDHAKRAREPRMNQASAYAARWTVVKLRYHITRYEDLAAARYTDCVAVIQHTYQQLAGMELTLPDQSSS